MNYHKMRKRPLAALSIAVVLVAVTVTAASVLFIIVNCSKNNGRCDFENNSNSTTTAWRRRRQQPGKAYYLESIQEQAEILTLQDQQQQQDDIEIVSSLSSEQREAGVASLVFQKGDRPLLELSIKMEVTTRRTLGGGGSSRSNDIQPRGGFEDDREQGNMHDDIDCDDPQYNYQGDELEACKEQLASQAPTEADSEFYETLFPQFGDDPEGEAAEMDSTFVEGESTGNPQDLDMNATQATMPPNTPSDEIPPPPMEIANGIRLTLSMGIVHLEDLMRDGEYI